MLNMAIAAVAMAVSTMAPVQDNMNSGMQHSTSMHSGPWQMRKSTGNDVHDRFMFVMDRTLNAAEAHTVMTMFRNMPGGTEQIIKEAVLSAIGGGTGTMTSGSGMAQGVGPVDNGMGPNEIYLALEKELSWTERGALHKWLSEASSSEQEAVLKLVRRGAWANSMWTGNR